MVKHLQIGWLLLLVWAAGCTTASPLVNWDRRIGNYTYNLALVDLGVPVRSSTLPDESMVADWLTHRNKPGTPDTTNLETESGYVPPPFWNNPFPNGGSDRPNQYLRLTFGPDQKLTGWRRYSQD